LKSPPTRSRPLRNNADEMEPFRAAFFSRLAVASIIGVGISSVTTQILTIREFLSQFHGNEITIGLVVFCWLVLTGLGTLGAKCFKKASPGVYLVLALMIGVWPLLQIAGIRVFRELFFTHGVSPGFYPILMVVAATIAPTVCSPVLFSPTPRNSSIISIFPLRAENSTSPTVRGIFWAACCSAFLLVYWLKPFAAIALCASFLILATLLMMGMLKNGVFWWRQW
jgi:spermidine synthase